MTFEGNSGPSGGHRRQCFFGVPNNVLLRRGTSPTVRKGLSLMHLGALSDGRASAPELATHSYPTTYLLTETEQWNDPQNHTK